MLFRSIQELIADVDRRLRDELHARGMTLLLDVVLNHVAFDAPLTRAHPDWFHHQGNIEDWNDPRQLTERDVMGLPDLAQEREEVYRYLRDAVLGWLKEVEPDGLRLDAVKHIGLPFWARLSADLHSVRPDLVLLGELLDGRASAVEQTMRLGHLDTMFDFPLHFAMVDVFCKGAHPGRIAAVYGQDRLYAHPERLVTLLEGGGQ